MSLSVATQRGSLPVAWQLYLPKEWIEDRKRAARAGIPDELDFATKPQIALTQRREALASGVTPGIVLADAGYGDETAFRDGVTELGLLYPVGVRPGASSAGARQGATRTETMERTREASDVVAPGARP